MNLDEMYDYLVEMGIATADEIELVTSINGWNETSFNDILEVRTGYRNFEQYMESEDEESYETYFGSDDEDAYEEE